MEIAKIIVGIIHILLSIILIALILLQSGKEAGLSGAVAGAADSFFGKNKGRTMDAIFSKFTKICAIGFLITSLFLAYGDSVIKNTPAATPQSTAAPQVTVAPSDDAQAADETAAPEETNAPEETAEATQAPETAETPSADAE